MIKLTDWELKCHCDEYDKTLGNYIWCFYHKGPHPLDIRKNIVETWHHLRVTGK